MPRRPMRAMSTSNAIAEAAGQIAQVAGRFERVDPGQPFTVIVDYAHTDDALRTLLR